MLILRTIRNFLRYISRHITASHLENNKKKEYPYIVSIHEFNHEGCRFEVSTPTESHRIEQYGDEKSFIKMMLNEVRHTDVFYDIGACVGLISAHVAKKGSTVIAFEPDPGFRDRLKINLGLNELQNVKIIDWAVSDMQGELSLYTDGVGGNSPSLRNVGGRSELKVFTETIDNAIARNEIPKPDVMKMDIEGAEMLALRGMNALLSSTPPRTIFIEIHPSFLSDFGSSAEEVERLIESYGYQAVYKEDASESRTVQCIHCIYTKINQ